MTDNAAESERVVRAFFQAINDIDFETFGTLIHPDIDFIMIGTTILSGTAKGKEEFMAVVGRVGEYCDGFIKLTIDKFIVADDWVTVRSFGEATTVKGEPYNNTYLHLIRVEDGQLREFMEYLDTEMITNVLVK